MEVIESIGSLIDSYVDKNKRGDNLKSPPYILRPLPISSKERKKGERSRSLVTCDLDKDTLRRYDTFLIGFGLPQSRAVRVLPADGERFPGFQQVTQSSCFLLPSLLNALKRVLQSL